MVGKEIINKPLLRAWKTSRRVSFKDLEQNMFLIDFEHGWDKARIMKGRPWTFDGSLVSFAEFDCLTTPTQLEFDKGAFWVRMSNLPCACMGKEISFHIGSSIGKLEEVDVAEDGVGWGEYFRVRIVLDLLKPFSRGRVLKLG